MDVDGSRDATSIKDRVPAVWGSDSFETMIGFQTVSERPTDQRLYYLKPRFPACDGDDQMSKYLH